MRTVDKVHDLTRGTMATREKQKDRPPVAEKTFTPIPFPRNPISIIQEKKIVFIYSMLLFIL